MISKGTVSAQETDPGLRFRQTLERIEHLPTLPEVITRILSMVEDADSSIHRISEVVGQDQSLVASILRMVNSPYYGLSHRVVSIQHAIVVLGLRSVRNIALSSVLVKTFGESSRDHRFDRSLLWRHTVACAVAARYLAQHLRSCDPEEAFLAGLLHDIGLVVYDQHFHDEFRRVIDVVVERRQSLCTVEREILGHDHGEAGAILARRWSFPPPVVDAIACHHRPDAARTDPLLASLVHLGDHLVRRPDELKPVRPKVAEGPQPALEETESSGDRGFQIWEGEALSSWALETARIDPAQLESLEAGLAAEWTKAQGFLHGTS
jgi:putative nucleotidyltransferase with HDIG domain